MARGRRRGAMRIKKTPGSGGKKLTMPKIRTKEQPGSKNVLREQRRLSKNNTM